MMTGLPRLLLRMIVGVLLFFYVPLICLLTVIYFPYDTDRSLQSGQATRAEKAEDFYQRIYLPKVEVGKVQESAYIERANQANEEVGVRLRIEDFVRTYQLERKRVLEIGSGSGSLQDVVADYTGLDISPSVAPRYHKPFVVASATSMPFPDNSFDAVWTIWVLEHVAEPERMLMEARRVLKPDGLLYLQFARNCVPWAAQGYELRPYSAFGFGGKLVKASLPLRKNAWRLSFPSIRLVRLLQYEWSGAETRLRFHALTPNYDEFWGPDSDAAVSLDSYETFLWFRSRGDSCLSCGTVFEQFYSNSPAQVFQINKRVAVAAGTGPEGH